MEAAKTVCNGECAPEEREMQEPLVLKYKSYILRARLKKVCYFPKQQSNSISENGIEANRKPSKRNLPQKRSRVFVENGTADEKPPKREDLGQGHFPDSCHLLGERLDLSSGSDVSMANGNSRLRARIKKVCYYPRQNSDANENSSKCSSENGIRAEKDRQEDRKRSRKNLPKKRRSDSSYDDVTPDEQSVKHELREQDMLESDHVSSESEVSMANGNSRLRARIKKVCYYPRQNSDANENSSKCSSENGIRAEKDRQEDRKRSRKNLPKKRRSDSSYDDVTPDEQSVKHELREQDMLESDHVSSESENDETFGKLVWGRLGSSHPWPAMIIRGAMIYKKPASEGSYWLFWFGDHKVSEIPAYKTTEFVGHFVENYRYNRKTAGRTFKEGVLEAISICNQRSRKQLQDHTDNTLLDWALSGFPSDPSDQEWKSGGCIPDVVMRHVRKICENIERTKTVESSDDVPTEELINEYRGENIPNKDYFFRAVGEGNVKLDDICIACDRQQRNTLIDNHPFFKGGLCCYCKDRLKESVFVVGDDGTKAFCTVCSNGGRLFVCDEITCGRVYCEGCVEMLVGPDAVTQLEEKNTWNCYLCAKYDPVTHGLLEGKPGWRNNLLRMFYVEPIPQMLIDGRKRPIRVLSLFDGITTGRLILEQLGIEVEEYFACEIDPSAMAVTSVQFGGKVTQLGDVKLLTSDKIASLGQIDLLIGGSPCQDLSLCNPERKGLFDGTGTLFFDFLKILNALKERGNFFWLYENVASMEKQTKDSITGYFGCQPALWDAVDFSCQKRARYFWGNIPGMRCPLQIPPRDANCTLQDVLTPNLNRRALVGKVRTITTKSNSLLQHKTREFPIEMGTSGDTIWVQELERIFGFPPHYTDVCNFTATKRKALLGNAWSVPVVKHLLTPLRDFFLWKPQ